MQLLTVSELNSYLREMLDADEVIRDIWVEGEVSTFKQASSGHCYFSLKDGGAVIKAVMWKSAAARLAALPASGDAVVAHGSISFYTTGGDIQLYADSIQPAGVGELHARFEALKAQLAADGWFDESRKRSLLPLPQRVGVATSTQGAALQDILNVLGRRCPLVEVVVAHCNVQGAQAAESIVAALATLAAADVDAIILARGGGSLEDLWCFNEEAVVRAVFASPVPVVTGVGHETDTTLVDYVADVRAPTPSAAAELIVPELAALDAEIESLRLRLNDAMETTLTSHATRLDSRQQQLQRLEPVRRLSLLRQQVDDRVQRLTTLVTQQVALRQSRMDGLQARLGSLNPRATLERGFALVRRPEDGGLVSQASQVSPGETLLVVLHDGSITVTVQVTDTEKRS